MRIHCSHVHVDFCLPKRWARERGSPSGTPESFDAPVSDRSACVRGHVEVRAGTLGRERVAEPICGLGLCMIPEFMLGVHLSAVRGLNCQLHFGWLSEWFDAVRFPFKH